MNKVTILFLGVFVNLYTLIGIFVFVLFFVIQTFIEDLFVSIFEFSVGGTSTRRQRGEIFFFFFDRFVNVIYVLGSENDGNNACTIE